jgi:hypothetical protein
MINGPGKQAINRTTIKVTIYAWLRRREGAFKDTA